MTKLRAATSVAAVLSLLASGAAMLAAPAAQAASRTLWVSNTAPAVGGNGLSCGKPGYATIQSALSAAPSGATINVCAGTYTEQLQITSSVTLDSVHGKATVQLPDPAVPDTTACDAAINAQYPGGTGDEAGISVCGDVTVNMRGIIVDAAWPGGTCDDSLYGILVAGGATLGFADSSVIAAGAVPLNGCQGGVGIQGGLSYPATDNGQAGHLVLTDSSVSGYQKNGITIDGAGSAASIDNATVTGIGPTTQTAQNGIQISDDATARVTSSRVTGDECNLVSVSEEGCGANTETEYQGAAVLLYGADPGTTVTHSELDDSDMGIYYSADPAAAAPASATATFSKDTFTSDRYESVVLDQGDALLEDSTMTGGQEGIEALQYSGQTFGINSTVDNVRVSHMSNASVAVLSDQAAGDFAGRLKVDNSLISTAPVRNNSANVRIVESSDR